MYLSRERERGERERERGIVHDCRHRPAVQVNLRETQHSAAAS